MIPQAVILLGGKGTRIAAQFPDVPKCLVPVAGRPFLEWQLDWLKTNGIRRVLLAAGHKADVLADALTRRPADELDIHLLAEPTPLGTGGALKFVEPQLSPAPILVLNGDSLLPNLNFSTRWKTLPAADSDVSTPWKNFPDFSTLWKSFSGFFHAMENYFPQCGKLFVTPISAAGRFGTVEFDADGRITAFREKAERAAGFVNAGIYWLPRKLIAAIPAGRAVSLETEIFPALAAQGNLWALPAPPPLLDMGTPAGRAEMERVLRSG